MVSTGQDASVLRNYNRWRESLNDFSWLDGVTTGASDIDQVIERMGWVVFFEGKPLIDNELRVTTGQHRLFETLAHAHNQQVWVVASATTKLTEGGIRILVYPNTGPKPARRRVRMGGRDVWHVVWPAVELPSFDLPGLRDQVAQWWSWAGDNPYGGDQ